MAAITQFSRAEMTRRVARDIPEGWYVNLGIGIPTMVADHIAADREIIFQSENGLIGMGQSPAPEDIDPWLINAGKQHVTLVQGGAFFHHADSFAMIRGGHIDLCVLGAFQVSCCGDLANWMTLETGSAPAVGGAMDLAAGAKRVWVVTEHNAKDGTAKLVETCSYPITAIGVVSRIYTNLAVIDVGSDGFSVLEMAPGLDLKTLQQRTAAPLRLAELVRT